MSGAFPISTANFETMGIKSLQDTIISKSLSGKKLSRQIDNQRFTFTARIITAKRSDVYGELMAFKHEGFWQPMDTLRDKITLNNLSGSLSIFLTVINL